MFRPGFREYRRLVQVIRLCLPFLLTAVVQAAPVISRQSDQFTVLDARSTAARSPGRLRTERGEPLLPLDADVLLLSSERIRTTLLWELGLPREGGDRIRLILYLASKPDNSIGFSSQISLKGWEYELAVPDQVEGQSLARALVGVLLLEAANRGQGPKSAEVPLWLVEGMTQHLISVAGPDLVVSAVPLGSMRRTVRERRGLDYLQGARLTLRTVPPLSFSELSYPKPETLAGNKVKAYQASAQLFVYELLHSPNGVPNFIATLRELPNCWNWETALFHNFAASFSTRLDLEKFWAVHALAFIANDPERVRFRSVCLDRLDAALSVAAQIRLDPQSLPERRILTLQQVMKTWSFGSQVPVLQQKLSLLAALRLNVPSDLVSLIDSYQRTLATYLQRRSQAGRNPENRMQPTYNSNLVTDDAVKGLEQLDQQRKALRPEQQLSANSPTSP